MSCQHAFFSTYIINLILQKDHAGLRVKIFRIYFGIQLGHLILQHSDNLSKTLQSDSLYAAAGQKIAAMTIATLKRIRNDESFDLFWQKIEMARQSLEVGEPILPRK